MPIHIGYLRTVLPQRANLTLSATLAEDILHLNLSLKYTGIRPLHFQLDAVVEHYCVEIFSIDGNLLPNVLYMRAKRTVIDQVLNLGDCLDIPLKAQLQEGHLLFINEQTIHPRGFEPFTLEEQTKVSVGDQPFVIRGQIYGVQSNKVMINMTAGVVY